MSDKIFLSVIIPSYLEEENLRVILPLIDNVLSELRRPFEVLIIDTMEKMDGTESVCQKFNHAYINREGGNYYSNAVITGLKYAKGEYIIFMDADGSHSPDFIPKLIEHANNFDVVVASRYVKGGSIDNSMLLVLMSKIVNFGYSFVLNIKCKDISNSFKLYQAKAIKGLHLTSKNFDIIEEILFKLKLNNKDIKIKEVPFAFKKRMFGTTKRNLFAFIFSYLITLITLRFGGKTKDKSSSS